MTSPRPGRSIFSLAALGSALCLLAAACPAQDGGRDREGVGGGVRLSGFGTFGLAHVTAPADWGYARSVDQRSGTRRTRADVDSRLGVQLNYAPAPSFELVGQLLGMSRFSGAADGDAVEWAFAAYRPTGSLAIRAGRLNIDQFVMSDYRNVGFAYPYVRPPVEYYGSIPTALDGVDVAYSWDLADSQWRLKAFAGRSKTHGLRLDEAFGLSIARESGGLLLRAGWSRADLAHNPQTIEPLMSGLGQLAASVPVPALADQALALQRQLDLKARPLVYATLGMSWDEGEWVLALELTRMSIGRSAVRAGYASVARRVGDVTVFGIVSGAGSNGSTMQAPQWEAMLGPLAGPVLAQQAQLLGNAAAHAASQTLRQTTISLGARWDLSPRLALKLQWDRVRVGVNGGYLWDQSRGERGRARVGTLLLDFVF